MSGGEDRTITIGEAVHEFLLRYRIRSLLRLARRLDSPLIERRIASSYDRLAEVEREP